MSEQSKSRTACTEPVANLVHLDTPQAATYLNLPANTLKTWRCTGTVKLPYVKFGGNVRYRKSDLDAFVTANTFGAPEEAAV